MGDVEDFMILKPSKLSLKTIEKDNKLCLLLDLDQIFIRTDNRKRIGMEED